MGICDLAPYINKKSLCILTADGSCQLLHSQEHSLGMFNRTRTMHQRKM